MIRRDYILRMIEEFIQALARLRALKQDRRWEQADGLLDEEFKRLVGAGASAVAQCSETDLLARLIEGEPTQAVHEKTLLLVRLLQEAGDLAAAQDRPEESRACYLKGLHLLLGVLASGEAHEFPDFVPQVEVFVTGLREAPLPLGTLAMLMQHYERTGDFGKAEDMLFALLDADPGNAGLLDFGLAFYQRLQGHSDATLEGGNLPRAELEAGLAELHRRKAARA